MAAQLLVLAPQAPVLIVDLRAEWQAVCVKQQAGISADRHVGRRVALQGYSGGVSRISSQAALCS